MVVESLLRVGRLVRPKEPPVKPVEPAKAVPQAETQPKAMTTMTPMTPPTAKGGMPETSSHQEAKAKAVVIPPRARMAPDLPVQDGMSGMSRPSSDEDRVCERPMKKYIMPPPPPPPVKIAKGPRTPCPQPPTTPPPNRSAEAASPPTCKTKGGYQKGYLPKPKPLPMTANKKIQPKPMPVKAPGAAEVAASKRKEVLHTWETRTMKRVTSRASTRVAAAEKVHRQPEEEPNGDDAEDESWGHWKGNADTMDSDPEHDPDHHDPHEDEYNSLKNEEDDDDKEVVEVDDEDSEAANDPTCIFSSSSSSSGNAHGRGTWAGWEWPDDEDRYSGYVAWK